MKLEVVDKLTLTFLVDNSIEWFGKLPPGFTHEMRQHLENDPPIDLVTGVPFIDLEKFCCGAHGFSVLIKTEVVGKSPHLTLFDTGPDSRAMKRNAEAMCIPVTDVERIILSHWHADHSGGIITFLNLRESQSQASAAAKPCVVDLHPDRPLARGIDSHGKVIGRLPADPTFAEVQAAGGIVELHAEGHLVADGTIWVSGAIPRVTPFEGGIIGGVKWNKNPGAEHGEWVKDEEIADERYAAADVAGKGLVIFSACSHAGIVNVVKDAIEQFARPVYMIVGGLHLGGPELLERIPLTVEFLANKMRPAPAYILPMHCSGFAAKIALEAAFGEGCVPTGVGHKVEVDGNRTEESLVFAPTIA